MIDNYNRHIHTDLIRASYSYMADYLDQKNPKATREKAFATACFFQACANVIVARGEDSLIRSLHEATILCGGKIYENENPKDTFTINSIERAIR